MNEKTWFAVMLSGGSSVSWSVTWAATIVTVHSSLGVKSVSGFRVNVDGPPVTVPVWAPLVAHEIEFQAPDTSTGSLKVTETSASTATPVASFAGIVDWTAGAASPTIGVPVTEMSSMPTHSSLPTASVVMTRTLTIGWLFAAAGSVTLTGVTSVARLGPVVASATNAGREVRVGAGRADAVLERDRLDGVVGGAVDVAQVVGDVDVGRARSC